MRDMISDGDAVVEPIGTFDAALQVCPKCQAEFAPKRSNQTYCSTACQKAASRNSARGTRKAEDRRANEEHHARVHALTEMIYAVPVTERLGVMQHILSHVSTDACLRRVLTDPKLLREPPRGDGRMNIAKAANAYTKKFFGVSIKAYIEQTREGTLNETFPVTRGVDHGSVPRLKPMRKAKCWHRPVVARDQDEVDQPSRRRDAQRSEFAREMADAAVKRALSVHPAVMATRGHLNDSQPSWR
ncbi:hypothetical protein [Roseovarius autotrophicus]|uniref:hypothetical protein n=1 Tax=Roseovarius autotrophicus TaxID=2824121 RepID=UPI001B383C10|nr:hypothetical protein [Roseovarius autotrophicus]